ncbi:cathepsin B-like [Oppia nitens]|uniref:cathepsin B-like n=1 Tax=Oppia nitens TaxID=1686743 RepID=UPI0023DAECE5|nr:cathepsin B-like [Oppia nitens]
MAIIAIQSLTTFKDTNEMVNYINSISERWEASDNFVGKQLDENMYKTLTNYRNDENVYFPDAPEMSVEGIEIPESFDAREKWPECASLREIRDQGECGACWAVSTTSVMSDRICIASKGKLQPIISAQNVVSCCNKYSCRGCDGGMNPSSWSYYVNDGIVTGGLYDSHKGCQPFSFKPCEHNTTGPLPQCSLAGVDTPKCVEQCEKGYNVSYTQDKWFGEKWYSIFNDTKRVQLEIMTNGPVVVGGYILYDDFLLYKSGIYSNLIKGPNRGPHAMKILGWGVENGVDYWLVANSWNTHWGDKGFVKILKGVNECHIDYEITTALPKIPTFY